MTLLSNTFCTTLQWLPVMFWQHHLGLWYYYLNLFMWVSEWVPNAIFLDANPCQPLLFPTATTLENRKLSLQRHSDQIMPSLPTAASLIPRRSDIPSPPGKVPYWHLGGKKLTSNKRYWKPIEIWNENVETRVPLLVQTIFFTVLLSNSSATT